MGYRIAYEPQLQRKYPMRDKSSRRIGILWLAAALMLGIVAYRYKDPLMQWLIPSDASVTQQAFTNMIESLQLGGSFNDAATAFCLEILENAR